MLWGFAIRRARLRIDKKVLGVVVGTAALGITIADGIAYVKTSSQLFTEAREKLVGLIDSQAHGLERCSEDIRANIESQGGSPRGCARNGASGFG